MMSYLIHHCRQSKLYTNQTNRACVFSEYCLTARHHKLHTAQHSTMISSMSGSCYNRYKPTADRQTVVSTLLVAVLGEAEDVDLLVVAVIDFVDILQTSSCQYTPSHQWLPQTTHESLTSFTAPLQLDIQHITSTQYTARSVHACMQCVWGLEDSSAVSQCHFLHTPADIKLTTANINNSLFPPFNQFTVIANIIKYIKLHFDRNDSKFNWQL